MSRIVRWTQDFLLFLRYIWCSWLPTAVSYCSHAAIPTVPAFSLGSYWPFDGRPTLNLSLLHRCMLYYDSGTRLKKILILADPAPEGRHLDKHGAVAVDADTALTCFHPCWHEMCAIPYIHGASPRCKGLLGRSCRLLLMIEYN
jgi:hypothetical protein